MTSGAEDLARRMVDAYESGDLGTVYSLYDPEIVWDVSRMEVASLFGGGVYRGVAGVRQFFREYWSGWDTMDFTYHRFVEAGDRVVVDLSQRVRGRSSGVVMQLDHYAQVWTARDGLLVRMDMFPTFEEACRATGAEPG